MLTRRRIHVEGVVQGVGFRPHVYRIATQNQLTGWICNTPRGVNLEVQGVSESVSAFLDSLRTQPPPLASITAIASEEISCVQENDFRILQSTSVGDAHTLIAPDSATCPDCLRELFDPLDRRYGYPFLNCTHCGPRFTILRTIPYDRPNTSMQPFRMCAACQAEYDDPANRRFHAQPNACWQCGPQLALLDANGNAISGDPIEKTIEQLRGGAIVAIKGLGGFHLAVDATQPEAVARLRERKHRWEKPLAILVADVAAAERLCNLAPEEQALLESPQRPIVLLPRKSDTPIAPQVAPGTPELGIFLPYTPVQHLLLHSGAFAALVMTSANRSEEPICIDNAEALYRLRSIADFFLIHNRDILLRCDDSIVRRTQQRTTLLRRARGFVPLPIPLACELPSVLAVGGELKNTICLTRGREAFLSQHIGDLENLAAYGFFEETNVHLQNILKITPQAIACDLHPEYFSTRWALQQQSLPVCTVQHHHAHLAACMAEHALPETALGIVLDGTGYGTDGNLWGGEILLAHGTKFERKAHLAYTPMPGGTQAIQEPWRMAVGFLSQGPEAQYTEGVARLQSLYGVNTSAMRRMIELRLRSPLTSSCGRLFDAVAALIGLRSTVRFEAQAAIELEAICAQSADTAAYPFEILAGDPLQISTVPLFGAILADLRQHRAPAIISRRFHLGLARVWADAAASIAQTEGNPPICLTGGCFQNVFLAHALEDELRQRGLRVYTHSLVPAGDGGLSLGQAWIAAQTILSKTERDA